jgi:hypothetical protein
MLKKLAYTIIFLMIFHFFICPAQSKSKYPFGLEQEVVYLKNNIHYQEHGADNKASYANWTNPGQGHKIIPVNTPVKISKWGRGFKITNTENKIKVLFEFHKDRMDMSIEEYLPLIISKSPISLDDLSEVDKQGIQDGKAYSGMTKTGVMMALGYPATHKTPSLESNTWIYWTNRFGTIAVEFNEQGIVESIRD